MTSAPSFDDIFAVMGAASAGNLAARVAVPADGDLADTATRFALALNILLDDLASRAADAEREVAERRRSADRLRVLSDSAHELAGATVDDPDHLLDIVARRLGELVGDMCAVRTITPDGEWVDAAIAVYHSDPEMLATMRAVMALGRQRIGDGISGRFVMSGQPFRTTEMTPAEYAATTTTDPRDRRLLERLGVTSTMTIPLVCRGKVIGVANMMRSAPGRPYTDDDLRLVQSVAAHAALAIGNARSFEAERAARDAAEKATDALARSERRFTRLCEAGLLGTVVGHLDGRITDVNATLLDLIGYSRDDIVSGRVPWIELTPVEWQHVDYVAFEQLTATGIAGLREKELIRKDGIRVPVLVGSAMLADGTDACMSFVLDLTERKAAAASIERLREERAEDAKFRGLLESAPDAMVIVDAAGAMALVNDQAVALFGYTKAELIGQPIELLIPERFRLAHHAHRADFLHQPGVRAMGADLELYARRKDGTELPIEVSLSPLATGEGLLVSSAIRDISDRKTIERQRAHLAAIVDSSDDGIKSWTLDGVVTSWNAGACRLFGYAEEEVLGIGFTDLPLIPADREAEFRAVLGSVAGGNVVHLETVRRRKDGRHIDVSLTVSPIRDARGRTVGVSMVARDIGTQKQAIEELARARDAVEAANRELEAFSYSVAHDLRAPLRGMNGFAQVLLDDYRDRLDADGQDYLHEILLNARKMGELIDGLLSLARVTRSALNAESVDLSQIARDIVAQLRAVEPDRAVEVSVHDPLDAMVDVRLARALLANLLGNAWKFTSNTPGARIELGVTERDGAPAFFVRDNGAGFDMAFAEKLFAPFQRLHTVTEFVGTGIGLATVQRIVQRHGGRIWAEGAVDRGATFYFTLAARAAGDMP